MGIWKRLTRRWRRTPSSHEKLVKQVSPRRLSRDEETILEWLLSVPFPGMSDLQAQARLARVNAVCTCGCKSIILEVPEGTAPTVVVRRVPVMGVGRTNGVPVLILLHVVNGFLSELEIVRADSKRLVQIPDPASLRHEVIGD